MQRRCRGLKTEDGRGLTVCFDAKVLQIITIVTVARDFSASEQSAESFSALALQTAWGGA